MSAGRLFIVSTPIGNLGDLTLRAIETLRSVAAILAEDTRHSRPLLERHGISTPLVSLHEHNERHAATGIIERLSAGESLALISDAGTPLISDPGARLVAAVIDAGIEVTPIPGASAILAALVASGLSQDAFTFAGFLSRKGRQRDEQVRFVTSLPHPVIVYEAPPRVADTLRDLATVAGPARRGAVARELTKMYEEVRRGTLAELAAYYAESPPRGECVIVVEGATASAPDPEAFAEMAATLRAEGLPPRDIVGRLVEIGAPRNLAYRLAHITEGSE